MEKTKQRGYAYKTGVICTRCSQDTNVEEIAASSSIFALMPDLSLFTVFASILLAYLYRVSGNANLAIGVPFQTRPLDQFKETVGFFMEAASLRVKISPNETFSTLIEKVKDETFEILHHYPYAAPNPLNQNYEVLLNFHPHINFPRTFGGLPMEYKWVHSGYGFDSLNIQIEISPEEEGFQITFDYHENVFDEDQRNLVIQHFLQTLDAAVHDFSQRIATFDLLSEKENIIWWWN